MNASSSRHTKVSPLDTLLAVKALALAPGLLPSDRLVGIAIIEHFSRKTGRCDPGLKRLAFLVSLNERSVIRATGRLAKAGLFVIRRHGGLSNRNAYEPNWSRYRQLEAHWRSRFDHRRPQKMPDLSPSTGQTSPPHPDSAVRQTFSSTCIPKPRSILTTSAPGAAALNAAERRWTASIHEAFGSDVDAYARVIEAIDESLRSSATEAELKQDGAGLIHILTHLERSDDGQPNPNPGGET